MTRNIRSFLGVAALLAAVVGIVNCAVQPVPQIFVSLTPSKAQTLEAGQTLNITGAVPNDLTNAGVTWSINPATGEGTLVNPTLTSVTYQAPATVTQDAQAMVVASANVQPAKTNQLVINLVPGPSFTNPNLTGGFVGTAYSATVSVTGGIAPYTWTVASGALPNGLSLTNANTPTVSISGTPTTVGTFMFTIMVTDSVGASFTSNQLSIQIQAANTLRITSTSPLPNATVGTAYSFTFAASGGTKPYSWSVANGSTLPAPLMLSAAGVLTGTPTTSGTSTFSITVTDSENPTVSATVPFSLTINPQGTGTISGGYAFVFHGTSNITVGNLQVAQIVLEAGTFTIAADGTTVSGVLDYNTTGGQNFIGQSFTGTANVGANNRGTVTFNGLSQGSQTFAFSMDATLDHGRFIELDSSGIQGSGEMFKQTFTTCTVASFSGNYVFGMTGGSSNSGNFVFPATTAGRLTSDGISGLSQGEQDYNTPFQTGQLLGTLSGTYTTISTGGACQLDLGTNGPLTTVNLYPISATSGVITKGVLIQTDPVLSTTLSSIMAGQLDQQVGVPFGVSSSLTGPSVGAVVGQISLNGEQSYVPDVWVAQLAISGTSFALNYTEDEDGVLFTFSQTTNPTGPAGNFSVDQFGRVTFTGGTTFAFQMYLINVNQGVFLTTDTTLPNPVLGYFDPQTTGATFSASTIQGTFESGTIGAQYYLNPNIDGEYTLDGTSAITGTQDTGSSSGNLANQSVAGTYTGINGTTGFGNFTLTSPASTTGVFCIVSPGKFVGITTPVSATGANPVTIVFGH